MGKTTIAYTLARRFEFTGAPSNTVILGGNFFCSRQFEETKRSKCIIRTIAYHLALACQPFADVLKFDVVYRGPKAQVHGLLVEPWKASEAARLADPSSPPYFLVIIDALDEIEAEGGAEFLRALFDVLNESQLRGLKFFATSRLNPDLVERVYSFEQKALYRLQDVGKQEAWHDVRTFLAAELPHLAGRDELGALAGMADGLFIHAATVARYVAECESPAEQEEILEKILSVSHRTVSEPSMEDTRVLDELYLQILAEAFGKARNEVIRNRRLQILHTFLCTAERTSAALAANLLSNSNDRRSYLDGATVILKALHAVLYVEGGRVLSYHKSFSDFLFNQSRSGGFWCDQEIHHRLLTESCFRLMATQLQFNIANIASSFTLDRDNVALKTEIEQNISPALAYSCRYWSHHISAVGWTDFDQPRQALSTFLQLPALFWMEAMNLLQRLGQCDEMLRAVANWVREVSIVLAITI